MTESLNTQGGDMEGSSPRARGRVPADRGSDRIVDRGSDQTTTHPPTPRPAGGGQLATSCSRCSAQPGEPCKDRNGAERKPHAGRGTPATGNEGFKEHARQFHERHMPSLPAPFVYGAYSAERALAEGREPEPAAVRARVQKRLKRIDDFERQDRAA